MQNTYNNKYLIAGFLMIAAAFIQCYKTIHNIHWAIEPDFDRDIAYIRGTLDGNYGKDPNYAGQYMWYNPLIFLTETLIVKLTGLPINIVVARAGAFLNLINPIVFFIVIIKLFDYKIALAALLSFLFLAAGNLPCWGVGTYSPWMISDTFVQFLFYISIFCCYRAFTTQKMLWFVILGAIIGLSFLGHSAPVFLIIFIIISLQVQNVFGAIRAKNYTAIKTFVIQGIFTFIPFVIFAFPFLYYVYGKYHFHFINRIILQCAPGVFARKETVELLKLNVTFSLLIAAIGFVWFYFKFEKGILRRIIWNWLIIAAFMYFYESAVPTVDKILHVNLPDTIPAFHYFFYLKTLQSVFFAFGFIYLFNWAIGLKEKLSKAKVTLKQLEYHFLFCVLVYAAVYYPIYSNRADFTVMQEESLLKGNEMNKIDVYDFISKSVPLDNVILCSHDMSLFPVMPTGIKMVSVETYFSNPYVSYDKREKDRNDMLKYLTKPDTTFNTKLFSDYKVNLVLLTNKEYEDFKCPPFASSKVIYHNNAYTILSFVIKS
jgi:hypothetical protein